MFGGLVSSAPSWPVPAVVVAYLVGGPVAALIGGLAQAGLTSSATYYNGKRKARRDHAVSYLLRLVEEQKPLLLADLADYRAIWSPGDVADAVLLGGGEPVPVRPA